MNSGALGHKRGKAARKQAVDEGVTRNCVLEACSAWSDEEFKSMQRRHFQMSATQSELHRMMEITEAWEANKFPDAISNHMKLALDEVLSNTMSRANRT